jgi:hypothetical protein
MPVNKCEENGKPGYRWGNSGKCYTYTPGDEGEKAKAKQMAFNQGLAIGDTDMKKVDRVDFLMETIDDQDWLRDKFKLNKDNGFLEGRAIVTNAGVFSYLMPDGSIQRELRPIEEVTHPDSIESLKLKPMTNNHPPIKVNAENTKDFQVGFIGDDIRRDQLFISAPMAVTEEDAIGDVQAGKRALSCGYTCDLEDSQGVWLGVPYDAIQRNIRYNHVAIVDRGRAGDAAVMKFDGAENNLGIRDIKNIEKNIKKGDELMSNLKKITIDGVEYEGEAKVIESLSLAKEEIKQLKIDNDTMKKDKVDIEANRDQLKEENEKLKKDMEEATKANPEVVEKAVKERMVVLDSARRAKVEIKSDMSELEIKKLVVKELFPGSEEKLDSADEVYVNARFDGAIEKLDELDEEAEKEDNNDLLKKDSLAHEDKKSKEKLKYDSNSAYERMVERDLNSHKKDEGGN